MHRTYFVKKSNWGKEKQDDAIETRTTKNDLCTYVRVANLGDAPDICDLKLKREFVLLDHLINQRCRF